METIKGGVNEEIVLELMAVNHEALRDLILAWLINFNELCKER